MDTTREQSPYVETTTQAQLSGPGLLAGRLLWLLVCVLCLVLFAASLPASRSAAAALSPLPFIPESLLTAYVVGIDIFILLVAIVLGAFLFWRQSENWVALQSSILILAYATAISFAVESLNSTDAPWHDVARLVLSIGEGAGLLGGYVFPDGRFVPRWTKGLALFLLFWIPFTYLFPQYGPNAWPPPILLLWRFGWLMSIVVAQTYRYLRVSSPTARQQTKWVLLGLLVSAFFTLLVYSFVFLSAVTPGRVVEAVLVLLLSPAQKFAFLLIPITLIISIQRYRLWDVNLVIGRSLVYGTLTLMLAALFGATLFLSARLFQSRSGEQQSLVAVAVTALIFGALFQPLRARLRRAVDRHLFHIQIDYRKAPARQAPGDPIGRPLTAFGNMFLIGHGGNAEVYRAEHPTLKRPVAVKVLSRHRAAEEEFRRRFEREAQALAALKHPHIVQVFDYGEQNGLFFMVLEYIDGPDLGSYLRQHAPLSLAQTRSLVEPLAGALDYAHAQGLIHRDIKPANILLERGFTSPAVFRPVLTDFGIARLVHGGTELTQTGGVIGTLDYIAPEQIQAAPDLDHRADLYAFGVVVYRMLTGRLPFETRNVSALLLAHLNQPPPDPRTHVPDLPPPAAAALLRVLAKNREQRYQTAGAFVQALWAG